ncbi:MULTISPECIES: hypothetical protein [Methanobacterium]|uniref:Uncharacterized protein n=1 Tax=Methanobacterium spitsbergense TaxID=2874285 RepID=A0A8T5UU09_9EURY|nr:MULTISPECIES: hypothetical protein [Methanobacterium]MBZ2165697.1 hypothetical protein [Methanobacterium spitsbergense]
MLHITRKENIVLNQIKYYQNEYKNGIPYRILKLELDLSEMDLKDILMMLDSKNIISYQDGTVKLLETGNINVWESKEAVKKEELNQTEEKAFEIIKEVAGESGLISKTLLEGHMLYGGLKLTSLKTYSLIIALENKGLIKKIQLHDGEYYTLNF